MRWSQPTCLRLKRTKSTSSDNRTPKKDSAFLPNRSDNSGRSHSVVEETFVCSHRNSQRHGVTVLYAKSKTPWSRFLLTPHITPHYWTQKFNSFTKTKQVIRRTAAVQNTTDGRKSNLVSNCSRHRHQHVAPRSPAALGGWPKPSVRKHSRIWAGSCSTIDDRPSLASVNLKEIAPHIHKDSKRVTRHNTVWSFDKAIVLQCAKQAACLPWSANACNAFSSQVVVRIGWRESANASLIAETGVRPSASTFTTNQHVAKSRAFIFLKHDACSLTKRSGVSVTIDLSQPAPAGCTQSPAWSHTAESSNEASERVWSAILPYSTKSSAADSVRLPSQTNAEMMMPSCCCFRPDNSSGFGGEARTLAGGGLSRWLRFNLSRKLQGDKTSHFSRWLREAREGETLRLAWRKKCHELEHLAPTNWVTPAELYTHRSRRELSITFAEVRVRKLVGEGKSRVHCSHPWRDALIDAINREVRESPQAAQTADFRDHDLTFSERPEICP